MSSGLIEKIQRYCRERDAMVAVDTNGGGSAVFTTLGISRGSPAGAIRQGGKLPELPPVEKIVEAAVSFIVTENGEKKEYAPSEFEKLVGSLA